MHKLQRKPTFDEVREDRNMPNPNDYAFYWRSFGEAVDAIWSMSGLCIKKLAIPRMIIKKGGEDVAKKTSKEWPHTEAELLELAVGTCKEKGRMPKRRAWTHGNYCFSFQELIDVLGGGNEKVAFAKIEETWLSPQESAEGQQLASKTAKVEVQAEKPSTVRSVPQPEVTKSDLSALQTNPTAVVKRPRGRAKIVPEVLLEVLVKMQRELNLGDKLPTADCLRRYHEEHPDICPSCATFYNRLGKVTTWREQLEKYLQERPVKGSDA